MHVPITARADSFAIFWPVVREEESGGVTS